MTDDRNRPRGLYMQLIDRRIAQREAAGETVPVAFSPEYWETWRREHVAACEHDEAKK
jgi:hypothetical protein